MENGGGEWGQWVHFLPRVGSLGEGGYLMEKAQRLGLNRLASLGFVGPKNRIALVSVAWKSGSGGGDALQD